MTERYLIGLDVGTTSAKAVVFDLDGRIVASGRAGCSWTAIPGGAEIAAEAIAAAAHTALGLALESTPPGAISAIGIASLAESGVLLDAADTPLASVIAWHDKRDSAELQRLAADFGADAYSALTGLPFRQQWSITKQRWLGEHVPGVERAVLRLNVAEWVAYTLGAIPATEQSLASRTGWLDVVTREWSADLLEWSRLSAEVLPPLVTAGTALGFATGRENLARLAGAIITIAGHDHQSAAVGLGAIAAGDEVDSCGTAEALVRTVDPMQSRADILALTRIGVTVGWHASPAHWCLLAGTEGGLLLGRTLAMLGIKDLTAGTFDADAARLAESLVSAGVDANGLLVLGGIGDTVTPASVWRGSIELVTGQVARLHDSMSAIVGEHRQLLVTGGWSASPALIDSKRRRLGELSQPNVAEAGARGAAIFAGLAAGLWPDIGAHTLSESPLLGAAVRQSSIDE